MERDTDKLICAEILLIMGLNIKEAYSCSVQPSTHQHLTYTLCIFSPGLPPPPYLHSPLR